MRGMRTAEVGPRRDTTRQSDPYSRMTTSKQRGGCNPPATHYVATLRGATGPRPQPKEPPSLQKTKRHLIVVIYDSTQAGHARTRTPTRDNRMRFATEDTRRVATAQGKRHMASDSLSRAHCLPCRVAKFSDNCLYAGARSARDSGKPA